MELQGKPDFEKAMERVEAWFKGDMIDRPPVRFHEHNAEFNTDSGTGAKSWPDLKSRWFDAQYQVEHYLQSIDKQIFHGETFPVFNPNLGPNVYAAYFGAELDMAR